MAINVLNWALTQTVLERDHPDADPDDVARFSIIAALIPGTAGMMVPFIASDALDDDDDDDGDDDDGDGGDGDGDGGGTGSAGSDGAAVDTRLDTLDADVTTIRKDITGLTAKVDGLDTKVNGMTSSIEELTKAVNDLKTQLKATVKS